MTRIGLSGLRTIVTTIAITLTLTLAVAATYADHTAPRPTSLQDRIRASHVWGQAELRIGVMTSEPLMGFYQNGVYSGFDIEIARYIAAAIGFRPDRITFLPVTAGERIQRLQDGSVDLVVASFSITDERARLVRFAGPYFITHQEVIILKSRKDDIRTLEDLKNSGSKVCTIAGSTSEEELARRNIPAIGRATDNDCIEGVLSGQFVAMSSDKTILAGLLSQHPNQLALVNMPFGTVESYGIGIPIEDRALQDAVSYILEKSYLQGQAHNSSPWLTAYNATLGPWLGPNDPNRPEPLSQPRPVGAPDLVDFDEKALTS